MARRSSVCPSWCTHHQDFGTGTQKHATHIYYGPALWDGSRARVDIDQYVGRSVLRRPTAKELRTAAGRERLATIEANMWVSGEPLASALAGSQDAAGCRAAAAALLAAAVLLEATI